MEIIHLVNLNSRLDSALLKKVQKLNIPYESLELPGGLSELITIEISESDPKWKKIKDRLAKFDVPHFCQTFFSDDEILDSEVIRLIVTYENGYPQPEDTWVSTTPNYDVHCTKCGIHRQIAPFEIKSEPKLQKNDFMTLYWGSPVFVTNQVLHTLEHESFTGFEPWNVLIHASKTASNKIKQLKVLQLTSPGLLDGEELGYEDCKECGERKYYSHMHGAMSYLRDSFPADFDIVCSQEWFGAGGASAYREVFVRNNIAEIVLSNVWQGAMMKVVKLVD